MSLEKFVEHGWLRREPTSAQEIRDLLGIVSRSMDDAEVEQISDDLRFYTSFNAILALANAALRAQGYRVPNQPGHHTRTLETLEYTIGADDKLVRKLKAFSQKRNAASYDSAGSVSDQELQAILAMTHDLKQRIEPGLRATYNLP